MYETRKGPGSICVTLSLTCSLASRVCLNSWLGENTVEISAFALMSTWISQGTFTSSDSVRGRR